MAFGRELLKDYWSNHCVYFMPFGPASLLGVERFSEESEAPLELIPGDEDARKEQTSVLCTSKCLATLT